MEEGMVIGVASTLGAGRLLCYDGHYLAAKQIIAYKASVADCQGEFIGEIQGQVAVADVLPFEMKYEVDRQVRAAIATGNFLRR